MHGYKWPINSPRTRTDATSISRSATTEPRSHIGKSAAAATATTMTVTHRPSRSKPTAAHDYSDQVAALLAGAIAIISFSVAFLRAVWHVAQLGCGFFAPIARVQILRLRGISKTNAEGTDAAATAPPG